MVCTLGQLLVKNTCQTFSLPTTDVVVDKKRREGGGGGGRIHLRKFPDLRTFIQKTHIAGGNHTLPERDSVLNALSLLRRNRNIYREFCFDLSLSIVSLQSSIFKEMRSANGCAKWLQKKHDCVVLMRNYSCPILSMN